MTSTLDAPEVPEPEFDVDPYEKKWIGVSIALLLGFVIAVTVAGFAAGFQLPGEDSQVDPRALLDEPPWSEPGVFEVGPGEFEAYVIAQTWSFSPGEIVVPVGAEVTIFVTSPDLQHGLKITDTNINMMVIPGQVSKLKHTFDEVGEFPYICHEYCGQGHAAMFGTVRVVSQADYDALNAGGDASDTSGAEAGTTDSTSTDSTSSEATGDDS